MTTRPYQIRCRHRGLMADGFVIELHRNGPTSRFGSVETAEEYARGFLVRKRADAGAHEYPANYCEVHHYEPSDCWPDVDDIVDATVDLSGVAEPLTKVRRG